MFEMKFYWNLDLDFCALFFIIILMVYLMRRQILPLRQNRMFLLLMTSHFMVALLDIMASVMVSFPDTYSVPVLYLVNILYYCVKIMSAAQFLAFVLSFTGLIYGKSLLYKVMIQLPAVLLQIIVIFAPINHYVFWIDDAGRFYYGGGRILVFLVNVIYMVMAALHVYLNRKSLKRMYRWSTYLFCVFACGGAFLQQFVVSYTQTFSLGATAGLLVLCLSVENPDLYRDNTTSLFNIEGLRLLYEEYLNNGRYCRIGMMAFESYDEIRSTYGDKVMNEVLDKLGTFIRIAYPRDNIFYMHNGGFLFIDEKNDIEKAKEDAIELLKRPIVVGKNEVSLSPCFASFGKDLRPASYAEMRDALKEALGEAVYRGDGATVEVSQEMLEKVANNLEIEAAIDRAIKKDTMEIYFQPIYDTRKKGIHSAEVLVRINDEKLGLLMPDQFIGRAEESGAILMLGQKVFEKTCEFIRDHDLDELGLDYIEVNLSPVQCMREQLSVEFMEIVERYGIDYSRINLEITETDSTDSAVAKDNMEALLSNGMSFSLDDYGTGFSNLVNVMNLPLHIIKIDKSIVWAYFKEGNNTLLHVLALFKESNKEIVCEGVETYEMASELSKLGCDHEQGYYFSKPVPEKEFLDYLNNFNEVV